jgi:hypothetical protein
MRNLRYLFILLTIVLLSACASYYQKNQALMDSIYRGDYAQASKQLDEGKLKKQKRNQLLYFLNKGTVLFMNNQPQESNKYFQQADYFIEDYQKNIGLKAASFLTNPSIQTYEGENFEKVMVHYYTTLNYLQQGLLDQALVECKRMQLKLDKITDYYKGKNKYKNDAFVHLLTGIVYDAQKDFNNAFIAYRNAYKIYNEEYLTNLNTSVPQQLKEDLIRTALLTGFTEEARQYKNEFNLNHLTLENFKNTSSLVCFWNNGFGPIKDQWSINFSITQGANGWVNFVNHDLGLNFPFYAGNDSKSINSLKVIRVAFPRYISREPVYENATLTIDSLGIQQKLELVQNIDKIAYVSLQDRMLKELSEALLRLAVKQVAAAQLRKENDALGSALSVVNAISEQADTRNWQTLPNTINYTRVTLPAGLHQTTFKVEKDQLKFNAIVKPGQTTFKVLQSPYFKGYSSAFHGLE